MTDFFGGGEIYLLNLVEKIHSIFEICILTSSRKLFKLSIKMNKKYFKNNNNYKSYPFYLIKAIWIIHINKIDIVFLNGLRETFMAIFLQYFKVKIFSVRHTELHDEREKFTNKVKNIIYLFAAKTYLAMLHLVSLLF